MHSRVVDPYRAAMQIVYGVLLIAVGVIVGWFGHRLFRRGNYARDLATAADSTNVDPSWQIDARVLAEAIPAACFTVGEGGRIVHINTLAARDFSSFTIGGNPATWSASLADIIHRVMLGSDSIALETIFLGDPPRSLRVTAVQYAKGVLVMLVDVTEDVDFEEARRTFSAAVSHELRTPLARSLGLAETLALREITLTAPGEIDVPVAARLYEVVIQNLVDNALIHGGPDARVDVTVTTAQDQAYLTVIDTGGGIDAQHLPFVFQRFYRGDAARSGPGSGLGLALVKHIIEAHGGTVVAESDGATGTTIRVVLPLAT